MTLNEKAMGWALVSADIIFMGSTIFLAVYIIKALKSRTKVTKKKNLKSTKEKIKTTVVMPTRHTTEKISNIQQRSNAKKLKDLRMKHGARSSEYLNAVSGMQKDEANLYSRSTIQNTDMAKEKGNESRPFSATAKEIPRADTGEGEKHPDNIYNSSNLPRADATDIWKKPEPLSDKSSDTGKVPRSAIEKEKKIINHGTIFNDPGQSAKDEKPRPRRKITTKHVL